LLGLLSKNNNPLGTRSTLKGFLVGAKNRKEYNSTKNHNEEPYRMADSSAMYLKVIHKG
jgi:hypothetical protein